MKDKTEIRQDKRKNKDKLESDYRETLKSRDSETDTEKSRETEKNIHFHPN